MLENKKDPLKDNDYDDYHDKFEENKESDNKEKYNLKRIDFGRDVL